MSKFLNCKSTSFSILARWHGAHPYNYGLQWLLDTHVRQAWCVDASVCPFFAPFDFKMPRVNFTIEDNSPVLQYSTQWQPGSSSGDNAADKYSMSTFTVSDSQGDSMTFTYYGYDVQLFGAKRSNHGSYRVDVDGGNPFTGNGTSPGDGSFQVSLYSPPASLAKGHHTVTLTNGENKFLDVDYLTWQSPVGEDGEQLLINTFDDTHPAFSYFPSSSWNTNPSNQGRFFGTTGHTTSDSNAHMEFIFQGDAVTLYGPVDPAGAAYAVQIDGGPSQSFSANKKTPQAQMMMYQAFNLGPGMHNLTMRSIPSSAGGQQFLAVDYATVYSTASIEKATSGPKDGVSKGAIAGLVIGNLLLLLIILLGLICLYRYKRYGYINWRFFRSYRSKRLSDEFKEDLQLPRPFNLTVPPSAIVENSRWASGKRRLLRVMPSFRWAMSSSQQSSSSWESSSRYGGSYSSEVFSVPSAGGQAQSAYLQDDSHQSSPVQERPASTLSPANILAAHEPPPEYIANPPGTSNNPEPDRGTRDTVQVNEKVVLSSG